MNAAHIGTRGAILKDLDFDSAWQRGLNFLCKPKNEWPEEPGERVNNDPLEREESLRMREWHASMLEIRAPSTSTGIHLCGRLNGWWLVFYAVPRNSRHYLLRMTC